MFVHEDKVDNLAWRNGNTLLSFPIWLGYKIDKGALDRQWEVIKEMKRVSSSDEMIADAWHKCLLNRENVAVDFLPFSCS